MPTAGVVGNINAPSSTPEYWVGRYGNYQPHGHAGWDGRCPTGTPIRAMAAGVVLFADWGYNLPGSGPIRKWLFYAGFPGKLTVIQHWWGIGAYAHQSEFRVKAGDRVEEGQVIGLSGATGGVDPHVHVEALVDLSYRTGGGLIYGRTDPAQFFAGATLASAGTITTQENEDEMTPGQMQEIKNFVFLTVGTLFEQYHAVTRSHIVGEISKKVEDVDYKTRVFVQAVDNENTDRAIMDARAQEEATRAELDGLRAQLVEDTTPAPGVTP